MDSDLAIEVHRVPSLAQKVRLQDYAVGKFKAINSRKGTKKAIKQARILVNGERGTTGQWILGGETLELLAALLGTHPEHDLGIAVLFEDQHMAVVNKPAGILTNGNRNITLQNGLIKALVPSTDINKLPRPEPVHRLDYPTTGAVLVAKTPSALLSLKNQFEVRSIEKTYLSVAAGETDLHNPLTTPIDGKQAHTNFTCLESLVSDKYGALRLLLLHPTTGRRHQLRKQLAATGNPILGDPDYHAPGLRSYGNGLYLHAWSLSFDHPIDGRRLNVRAPIPKKFRKLFKNSIGELDQKKA